jgi:hypothetical protein
MVDDWYGVPEGMTREEYFRNISGIGENNG